jgi:GTP-binding protein Era
MSKPHKSGFVNLIGHPNVGKSTLANALVGERLSIITPKAQTTRHRIFGILNGENEQCDYQVVFSDTPGVLDPAYELQERMLDAVREALKDADVFCTWWNSARVRSKMKACLSI